MNALLIGTDECVRDSAAWLLWMEGVENVAVVDLAEATARLGPCGSDHPLDLFVLDDRELQRRADLRSGWHVLRQHHPSLPVLLLGDGPDTRGCQEPRAAWADPFQSVAIRKALRTQFPERCAALAVVHDFYPTDLPGIVGLR